MDKKYLFVLNPISGGGDDRDEVQEMLRQNLHGIDFEVWETTGEPDDPESIRQKIGGADWAGVLVGGGDGTIKMVVGALMGVDLPIGIIPLGSANGLATGFGIHGINDACHAVRKEKMCKVDVWDINGELCIHLSDFGFNAGLVKKSAEQGVRGMLSYAKGYLEQLKEITTYTFKIKTAEAEEEVMAKMLVIANGDKYGTGAVINPVGDVGDGKFEIIALNPDGLDEKVALSLALFQGGLEEAPFVKIWSVETAEIQNVDGADFQVDGEVMPRTDSVKITRMPHAVQFYSLE